MFVCHMQQILWLMCFYVWNLLPPMNSATSPTMKGCFQQLILARCYDGFAAYSKSQWLTDPWVLPELTKKPNSPQTAYHPPRWTHSEPFSPLSPVIAYPHWRVRYNFQLAMVWIIHALEAASTGTATAWSKTEDKEQVFMIVEGYASLQGEQK